MEKLIENLETMKEFVQKNIKDSAVEAKLSSIKKNIKFTYKRSSTCPISLRQRPENLSYKPGHIFSKNCIFYTLLPNKRKMSRIRNGKRKKEKLDRSFHDDSSTDISEEDSVDDKLEDGKRYFYSLDKALKLLETEFSSEDNTH